MAIDRNTVIKEAQKLAGKGQFDKAIAEWRKLVKEDPNDANVFNTIGDLCLKKNSKPDAVEAYQKAAKWLLQAAGPAGLLQFHEPGAAGGGFMEYDLRHSPVTTIYGGTSEINRNNVAERHLGLPKAR